MDCPADLNPALPPLEEDTDEARAKKIRWYEWKTFADPNPKDPKEQEQLWEGLKQLREKDNLLLKLQLKKTTGKLSPLGKA